MDLFGMPTGGPHHDSSKTNGRGENLKSPPHPSCLTRFDAHTCKPCRLLLLSRAKSCAFGLAVATTSTRRSSRPNIFDRGISCGSSWGRGDALVCLAFIYLFPSWSLLLPTTAPWAWPAVLLPMEHSESLHAIVIFLAGSSFFFCNFHSWSGNSCSKTSIVASESLQRKKPEVFYNFVLFIRVSGFRAEFISSLFLRKTCRRDYYFFLKRAKQNSVCKNLTSVHYKLVLRFFPGIKMCRKASTSVPLCHVSGGGQR